MSDAAAETAGDVAEHAMIVVDLGVIAAEAVVALDFVPIVVPVVVAVKDAMVSVAAAEHPAQAERLVETVIDAPAGETAEEVAIVALVGIVVVGEIALSRDATTDRRKIVHVRMSCRPVSRQRLSPPVPPCRGLPSISGSPGGSFLFPI